MLPMTYLYRNKPRDHFRDIQEAGNVMETVLKDPSGDPKSPINGKLSGLFFCANVNFRTHEPPKSSPFGDTRLSIPVHELLTRCNLYFTDFYCMREDGPHYIILVATKNNSLSDAFCRQYLLPVDPKRNPFFCFEEGGSAMVSCQTWVEIFYTESINLREIIRRGADITTVGSTSTSSSDGIPKYRHRYDCNISPPRKRVAERQQDTPYLREIIRRGADITTVDSTGTSSSGGIPKYRDCYDCNISPPRKRVAERQQDTPYLREIIRRGADITTVDSTGTSSSGGIPKYRDCYDCNISPPRKRVAERQQDTPYLREIRRGADMTTVDSTGTSSSGGIPKYRHCYNCNISPPRKRVAERQQDSPYREKLRIISDSLDDNDHCGY